MKAILRFNIKIISQHDIKQCLISWKYNIFSFFEDDDKLLFDFQKNIFDQVYKLLCHFEQKHVIDRIRRKVSLTVLHKLFEKFERNRLHEEALNEFASTIFQSDLIEKNIDIILNKLIEWTKKKYNTLIKSLKSSKNFVLFSFEIDDTMWVLKNRNTSTRLIRYQMKT